jgi:segregation and condensation protein B
VTPLARLLEAALFASPRAVPEAELLLLDADAGAAGVRAALEELRAHYDDPEEGHAVELVEQGGGWQILTRAEYAEAIERAQLAERPARLSAAALETLAVIAYRQPIGRAEVEEIRGVGAGGVLKTLQERGLIEVVGRGEGLGRPLLYGTTPFFLQHFGFRSLADLPRSEELPVVLARRDEPRDTNGEAAGIS